MGTILKRAAWFLLSLSILASAVPAALSQPAGPAPGHFTLQEYISELDRCSAVLSGPQSDPAAFRNLRATLPALWVVDGDGESYEIDTGWLTSALVALPVNTAANNPLLAQTRQRLRALRAAAESLEDERPSPDLAQSRGDLERILSAKEFQGASGPSGFDLLKARFYSWIWRQIERLLRHFRNGPAIGNAIAWTAIALAALLLALWAVRSSLRGGEEPAMDLEGASRPQGGWRDWLRNARAAAEHGNYRSAIHAAYWAGVMRLEDLDRLPADRARTPRETLRLLQGQSAEYAPLAQLTKRFELIWYGYRSASETDWNEAIEQLEKLGCLASSTPAIAVS